MSELGFYQASATLIAVLFIGAFISMRLSINDVEFTQRNHLHLALPLLVALAMIRGEVSALLALHRGPSPELLRWTWQGLVIGAAAVVFPLARIWITQYKRMEPARGSSWDRLGRWALIALMTGWGARAAVQMVMTILRG